jgi:hypothetical protein
VLRFQFSAAELAQFADHEADVFGFAIILNNAEISQYGSGTFLNGRSSPFGGPYWRPEFNRPLTYLPQSRSQDASNQKRFGVNFVRLSQFAADITYMITWRTPAGNAEQDDGDIEIMKATRWCDLGLCIQPQIKCRITNDLDVEPIPGFSEYNKPYAGYCQEVSNNNVFVSIIER